MRLPILILAAGLMLAGSAAAAPSVMSLDQCSDQYVLALSPREAIVGLSPRARARDSYLRDRAVGLPERRASAEAVLAAHPDVVVRYWGGDERLARLLQRRGVTVVRIEEATDFAAVRDNVRRVAAALDEREAGERMVAKMDADLAAARAAGRHGTALYLTPSGFTAGPGTLIDAVLAGAGLTNAATRPGYQPVSLEGLVMRPPNALVLGFFDAFANAMVRWGLGRHRVLQPLIAQRTVGSLPGAIAGCPGWFAAEGARRLAEATPR